MYKILIVDDEPLMQVGIKSMINYEELNCTICGLANNGEVALSIIEKEQPDIVICDIKMPIMNGLELIQICCERYGYGVPVFIFLTSYEEFSLAKTAVKYQASDYLIKLELDQNILTNAIKKAQTLVKKCETKNPEDSALWMVQKNEEKFYIRLLQNMFESNEQFALQSSFLDIELNADAYQCAYLEFFENGNIELASKQKFSLYLSCTSLLIELMTKYMDAKVISLDVKHCAVLIRLTKESTGTYTPDKDKILEVFTQLNESIRKYYNAYFFLGLGSIEKEPLSISASYQNARQAYAKVNETSPFVSCDVDQNTNDTHTTFNLSLFRETLSQALEEFDEVKFSQVIKEMCDIFSENTSHTTQAMDAACSILYMVISSLPDGEQTVADLFNDYPDHYRSIYRLHTVEQINRWLQHFSEKICAYFADRKSNHTNYTVNLVKQYINNHITEKLTLNDVANMINITPNYLSQLFKKHNDCGFNEYVNVAKINEAKRLMSEGQLKIYEISDALGFESSFYFSKVFKKIEGVSPKDYMNHKLL